MKFLGRRLFTLLSGISLLVGVAVIALWARSHCTWDMYSQYPYDAASHTYSQHSVNSSNGSVWIHSLDQHITLPWLADRMANDVNSGSYGRQWSLERSLPRNAGLPAQTFWQRAGFRWSHVHGVRVTEGIADGFEVGVPHWVVLIFTLLLPGFWLKSHYSSWQERRRRARGLCPACGYDLRKTTALCPECGKAFSDRVGTVEAAA